MFHNWKTNSQLEKGTTLSGSRFGINQSLGSLEADKSHTVLLSQTFENSLDWTIKEKQDSAKQFMKESIVLMEEND